MSYRSEQEKLSAEQAQQRLLVTGMAGAILAAGLTLACLFAVSLGQKSADAASSLYKEANSLYSAG